MDGALEIWLIDGKEVRVVPRRVMEMLSNGFDRPPGERWQAPPEPVVERSVVYFVKSGDFVKIGRTTNFPDRLAKLQVGTPHALEVLHVIKGGSKREAEIHRALRDYHYRGEWFHYCEPLIAYFESLE